MRYPLLTLLLLGSALLAGAAPATRPGPAGRRAQGDAAPLHLVVLHTNDIHGQLEPRPAFWLRAPNPPTAGGLARVAGYVNRVRREVEDQGAALLVLDAGDWSQGTPEGALDDGRAFTSALARVGYDAMCVGNHEFDHGVETLVRNLAETRVPAVVANVRLAGGVPLAPAQRVFERLGLRIAVVGLISTDTPRITHPSARACAFLDPAETLARQRRELRGEVDWFLPLTHLGVDGDRELARAHPDLDLIVGGHSHSLLPEGVREGSTCIVQAGSRASAVGRVDVWFDPRDKRVVKLEARIVDLFREPEAADRNEALQAECRAMLERVSRIVDVPIGTLAAPMTRAEGPLESSPAGNLITDLLRRHTGADVALQNRGGLRANLYAGVVTRRDVFDVLPFSNHLVVLTLSGEELLACMRQALEGPGRRGPEFSGMSVRLRRVAEGVELAELLVGGAPVDPRARYTLATNSFLAAGGDGYDVLAAASERVDDPLLLRDVLEAVFELGAPVTPPGGNRYSFVD